MGGMWREAKGKQEDTDGSGVSAANKHNPQQAIGSKASENTRHTDRSRSPPCGFNTYWGKS